MLQFALVGNPNCGKTALFNRLTGSRAKVANYAGVTVEKRSGPLLAPEIVDKTVAAKTGNAAYEPVEILDLPGTYSLFVTSPDEAVTRRVILGEMDGEAPPDVLVAVIDATHVKLGLRLVLELKALQRPMILVLNLADEAAARGVRIDRALLAERMQMPVVESVAIRADGCKDLMLVLHETARSMRHDAVTHAAAMTSDQKQVAESGDVGRSAFERTGSVEDTWRQIDELMAGCVTQPEALPEWQNRLDDLFMHPVSGMLILLTVLFLMFQAVFAWAKPVATAITDGFQWLGSWLGGVMPEGVLRDFMVDGVVAGLGGVLVFLPQILILFAFIIALEDSGYLPRAAFMLDRLMRGVGLSGRSFIPLLSSFACAVPGIMATRTVQDPRERLTTILVAPLMTCSARLPVYALVIAAFIPAKTVWGMFDLQGLTLFVLYVAGIVSAVLIAWILRRRDARREEFPLLMELPAYRWPSAYHFFIGLRERAWIFIHRVGTIILALTVLLWFLASYPAAPADATMAAIQYSYAGQLGAWMQPFFAPMGFNWQMCIALIPAMAAREVAVSALATVYAVADGDDVAPALAPLLSSDWSLPVALAYLAWFVYAPQCISTIAVVKRETNSVLATSGFVIYLFSLAYLAAWATYRVAMFALS